MQTACAIEVSNSVTKGLFRVYETCAKSKRKTPQTLDFTGFAGLGATGLEPVKRLLKHLCSKAFSVRVQFSCTKLDNL